MQAGRHFQNESKNYPLINLCPLGQDNEPGQQLFERIEERFTVDWVRPRLEVGEMQNGVRSGDFVCIAVIGIGRG